MKFAKAAGLILGMALSLGLGLGPIDAIAEKLTFTLEGSNLSIEPDPWYTRVTDDQKGVVRICNNNVINVNLAKGGVSVRARNGCEIERPIVDPDNPTDPDSDEPAPDDGPPDCDSDQTHVGGGPCRD